MAYRPTYSYDPTSATQPLLGISTLRLRLGDTDFSQIATPPLSVIFADQELSLFLSANQGDQIFALCDALLALANNQARLAAYVQLQGGGSVDFRQIAQQLREQSKEIRTQYINTPAEAYAEVDYGPFSYQAIVWNVVQRTLSGGI